MSAELKLFTVCPECGGSGEFNNVCEAYACPKCEGKGYVPWAPKAAPIVWVKIGQYEYKAVTPIGTYYARRVVYLGKFYLTRISSVENEKFDTIEEAQAACQTHANGVAKQLVEGNKQ